MTFLLAVLTKAVEIYSFILLAYAFLSWVPGAYESSLGRVIAQLVEPVLTPFRKLNLQAFGLDWTIFVVMILMNLALRILIRLSYQFLIF